VEIADIVFLDDAEFAGVCREEAQEVVSLNTKCCNICSSCGGECCQVIECGLYSPEFNGCPIYEFRPPACRQWFCSKALKGERQLSQAEVTHLKEIATPGLEWLPFTIKDEVARTMSCVKSGQISGGQAKVALLHTVLSWRQSMLASCSGKITFNI
jgi:hypothetical protein